MNRADELYYYVGEKPLPLTVNYKDKDGVLKAAALSGATLVAKTKIDDASSWTDVACTNNGDGSLTINWPTGTSAFALSGGRATGIMIVDVQVTSSPNVWYLPRFSIPIKTR